MKLTSPLFDEHEIELVRKCLDSGWVTQGPRVTDFERLVAKRQKVEHALATTSCTAGLHLAALALGLGPGDEVVVPAFTWITSANCAEYVGAKAVFADVDPATYNLDPAAFEAAISERTKALVVAHLFGLAADMQAILEIARDRGIAVIEDAACALGTTYGGRPVGGLGAIGCFSFHPRKIVTTGEGGVVATNDGRLAAVMASLRNHGSTGVAPEEAASRRPWTMACFDNLGFNLRMSDIQAAVGIAQMAKLDGLLAERRAAAKGYLERLEGLDEIVLPTAGDTQGHTFQSFVIRLTRGGRERRNDVMTHLAEHDIETRPGTHAVHRLGYYRDKYGLAPEDFPNAALCEDTSITLPLFPGISARDQDKVVDLIRRRLQR